MPIGCNEIARGQGELCVRQVIPITSDFNTPYKFRLSFFFPVLFSFLGRLVLKDWMNCGERCWEKDCFAGNMFILLAYSEVKWLRSYIG